MFNPYEYLTKTWLNSTYKYLEKTGAPVRPVAAPLPPPPTPAQKAAVRPGDFSSVEDYPITYDVPITEQFRTVPVTEQFKIADTSLPSLIPNKVETVEEISKQVGNPERYSDIFNKIYGGMMKGCLADQIHRAGNPNAEQACHDCAETGDWSKLILWPAQLEAIGYKAPTVPKSDVVQEAENKIEFTDKIAQGVKRTSDIAKFYASSAVKRVEDRPSVEDAFPTEISFQGIEKKLKTFIPAIPGMGDSYTLLMIGGGLLLFILLIRK